MILPCVCFYVIVQYSNIDIGYRQGCFISGLFCLQPCDISSQESVSTTHQVMLSMSVKEAWRYVHPISEILDVTNIHSQKKCITIRQVCLVVVYELLNVCKYLIPFWCSFLQPMVCNFGWAVCTKDFMLDCFLSCVRFDHRNATFI